LFGGCLSFLAVKREVQSGSRASPHQSTSFSAHSNRSLERDNEGCVHRVKEPAVIFIQRFVFCWLWHQTRPTFKCFSKLQTTDAGIWPRVKEDQFDSNDAEKTVAREVQKQTRMKKKMH